MLENYCLDNCELIIVIKKKRVSFEIDKKQ